MSSSLALHGAAITTFYRCLVRDEPTDERATREPEIHDGAFDLGDAEALARAVRAAREPDLLFDYAFLKYVLRAARLSPCEGGEAARLFRAFLRTADEVGHYREVVTVIDAWESGCVLPHRARIDLMKASARALRSDGDLDEARTRLETALVLAREHGERRLEASILVALGKIYGKYLGHGTQFAWHLQQAEAILDELDGAGLDPQNRDRLSSDRAIVLDCLGNLESDERSLRPAQAERAIAYLEKALVLNERLGNRSGMSRNIAHRALVRQRTTGAARPPADIARELERAWKLVRGDYRQRLGAGLRQAQYGCILALEGDPIGHEHIAAGWQPAYELRSFRNQIKILLLRAEALAHEGRHEKAEDCCADAFGMATERGLPAHRMRAAQLQAESARARGDFAGAVRAGKNHFDAIRQLRTLFEDKLGDVVALPREPGDVVAGGADGPAPERRSDPFSRESLLEGAIGDYRHINRELTAAHDSLLQFLDSRREQEITQSATSFAVSLSEMRDLFVDLWLRSVEHDLTHVASYARAVAQSVPPGLAEIAQRLDQRAKVLQTWIDREQRSDAGRTSTFLELVHRAVESARFAEESVRIESPDELAATPVDRLVSLCEWAFWGLVSNAAEAQEHERARPDFRLYVWVEPSADDPRSRTVVIANPGKVREKGFIRDWIRTHRTSGQPANRERGRGLVIIDEILRLALGARLDNDVRERDGEALFAVLIDVPSAPGPRRSEVPGDA